MSGVKHTPGPWRLVIDDTGGQWSGWPLCVCPVNDDNRSIVRTGGMWPYEWDAATSQREAIANARLVAAAPDLLAVAKLALKTILDEAEARDFDPPADPVLVAELEAALARARGEQDGITQENPNG